MAGERFEQRVKFWQTDLAYKAPEQLASRTAEAMDDLVATARAEFKAAGVLEEAHEVAPQQPFKGEEEMLGRVTRLWKLGRSSGLGGSAITQRPASLSKNITTQAEILIVHRTLGPQDVAAVREWIRYHGERDDILGELATLKTGEAFVWAPDFPEGKPIGLKRVSVLDRETFDSSATPKVGQRAVEPKALAPVDLERLRARMAATIEKAKAEDPRELRRRIGELERELATRIKGTLIKAGPAPKRVEVPVLKDAQIKRLEQLAAKVEAAVAKYSEWWRTAGELMATQVESLSGVATEIAATVRAKLAPAPSAIDRAHGLGPPMRPRMPSTSGVTTSLRPPATGTGTGGSTTPVAQRILDALAELEQLGSRQPQRELVAFLAGYAHLNSKGFTNAIGTLRSGDLIAYPTGGTISLTPEGRAQARPPDRPRSAEELQQRVIGMLGGASGRILAPLIAAYPRALPREVVVEKAGYGHPNSKGFTNAVGRLRTLGFIDYSDRGSIVAAPVLFLGG